MKGYVYILRSLKNSRFYIGSTNNLDKRFGQHLKGKCHTTLRMLPLELAFSQEFKSIKEARTIECRLKQMKRKDIIERIISEKEIKVRVLSSVG